MDEREGFLKLLAENEHDIVTRRVYADWLQERGEHEEAELQRKLITASEREGFVKFLAANEDDTATRLVFADWLDQHGEHDEADRQRKWPAAKEWLVKFCTENNPPPGQADPYGTVVSYEKLLGIARSAIEGANHDQLWFECRNNRALCNALREKEEEFWKHAALVTGAKYREPDYYDDDYGACPNC